MSDASRIGAVQVLSASQVYLLDDRSIAEWRDSALMSYLNARYTAYPQSHLNDHTFPLTKPADKTTPFRFEATFTALFRSLSALYFHPCFACCVLTFFARASFVCFSGASDARGVALSEADLTAFGKTGRDLEVSELALKFARLDEGASGTIGPEAVGRCWTVLRLALESALHGNRAIETDPIVTLSPSAGPASFTRRSRLTSSVASVAISLKRSFFAFLSSLFADWNRETSR